MQCQLRADCLSALQDADASPSQKSQAALQLSSCSATGFGCKKSIDESLAYLQNAAEWGSWAAQLALPRAFAAHEKLLPDLVSPNLSSSITSDNSMSESEHSDFDMEEFEEDGDLGNQDHDVSDSAVDCPQEVETVFKSQERVRDYEMSDSTSDDARDDYAIFYLSRAIDEQFWKNANNAPEDYYCWAIRAFNGFINESTSAAPFKVNDREFLGLEDTSLPDHLKASWGSGILENTADLKTQDGIPLELPLLHHVINCRNSELVELIVDLGADLESMDNDGRTPLHIACRAGDAKITRFLVDRGAKASVQDSTGTFPLHWLWTFEDEDIPDIARILVNAGADVNVSTGEHDKISDSFYSQEHQGTALHTAIGVRNFKAVRELLDIGADVDSCPYESMCSPLELAAQLHLAEMVQELLNNGSKLTSRNGGGWAMHHVGIHVDPLKRYER
jgi:ankyrin repeat protein